jgi:hypothetical protein
VPIRASVRPATASALASSSMPTATQRKKARQPGRRPGRPSKLDEVAYVRDGAEVTIAAAILDRIRTAMPVRHAAASVGIRMDTWTNWCRDGARARQRQIRIDQGAEGYDPLTPWELRLIAFLDEAEAAESQALATDWTRLGLLAAGSLPVEVETIVVRTDADGKELGRTKTTRRDKTLPNLDALKFRLQKRWPDVFGDRLELSGPEGGPIELDVTAAGLADRLRRIVDANAVEQDSREAEPGRLPVLPAEPAGLPRASSATGQQALASSPDADVPPPPD